MIKYKMFKITRRFLHDSKLPSVIASGLPKEKKIGFTSPNKCNYNLGKRTLPENSKDDEIITPKPDNYNERED
tara:strand:- start:303 stop:521 length:219 start_codon:yes stop_codon:yes gene_type:complete